MKTTSVCGLATLALVTGCVRQHVDETLGQAAVLEGQRFAREVERQSPFKPVELTWSEAEDLMKRRNPSFVQAEQRHRETVEREPLVQELTREVSSSVSSSLGQLFDPAAVLRSLRSPATGLPQQLASLGELKGLAGQLEENAWADAMVVVDSRITMRQEKVRLHRLMRLGEVIRDERQWLKGIELSEIDDPELRQQWALWQHEIEQQRGKWLDEVRDLFDAEYHDVSFVRDQPGLPTYRSESQPDLSDWQRWCQLVRSKELVGELSEQRQGSIPVVGNLRQRVVSLVRQEPVAPQPVREVGSVRKEVRTLVQDWREMKAAQRSVQALQKHATGDKRSLTAAALESRKRLHALRRAELEHTSRIWLRDERAWP